jgi:hypothetical protein
MTLRTLLAAAALVLPTLLPSSSPAGELPMTAEEFGLWRDYQSALGDPKVEKLPEKARLPAIAKNFLATGTCTGNCEKKLREAAEKGKQFGDAIGKQVEEMVRESLKGTEVGARLKELKIDDSAAHVVAYVTFTAVSAETIDREACLLASKVLKSNALVSTLKLEAVDSADDKNKLFEAIISRKNAQKIDEEKIVDFATTRYLRLFEKVKRAAP